MLSCQVLLANADFNAQQWKAYRIPRCRGGKLSDDFVQRLIEFFFPDLYGQIERATNAYVYNNPNPLTDPKSETNYEWLTMLREITFFWMQDAVALMRTCPEIVGAPPWSWIAEDANARLELEELGKLVDHAIEVDDLEFSDKLLAQNDMLQAVEDGVTKVSSRLDKRLAQLPVELRSEVRLLWREQATIFEERLQNGVRHAFDSATFAFDRFLRQFGENCIAAANANATANATANENPRTDANSCAANANSTGDVNFNANLNSTTRDEVGMQSPSDGQRVDTTAEEESTDDQNIPLRAAPGMHIFLVFSESWQ